MNSEASAYGLWGLVLVNSAVFIMFAYSFFKPRTTRDWRSFGAFSAFLVALFAEMYGFPLTIYFLSGWLQSRYPNVDWFSHDAGHLLEMAFGWKTNPHFGPFHVLSFVLVGAGFVVIAAGWRALYEAQQRHEMATAGVYSYVRHPQYFGFILVMLGFLVQWPTILTLAMFPVLVAMYVGLARSEERESIASFGDAYRRYMAEVPAFIPRFGRLIRPSCREEIRRWLTRLRASKRTRQSSKLLHAPLALACADHQRTEQSTSGLRSNVQPPRANLNKSVGLPHPCRIFWPTSAPRDLFHEAAQCVQNVSQRLSGAGLREEHREIDWVTLTQGARRFGRCAPQEG
jgi:protein-S-isoprenylcysteine O-methyltransferase Ste14